jgi:hypothetical protein
MISALQLSNAGVSSKMPPMPAALETSQRSGWLKACAAANARLKLPTLDVSHKSGWLKELAP